MTDQPTIDPQDDLTERMASVRRGDVSATARLERVLSEIERRGETLNAYHETLETSARATAADVDERIAQGGDTGPLAGAIVAIKDNICTTEGRTTCSSRMLEHYRSPFDATVIRRLRDADAILVGKTNLDEFAMGSGSEHCAWGPVRNPWSTDRVPGGSSGGSAAAVAADLCDAALGSDTGGSIRQPAALCGVVGLKPTYGRISRYGLVAFGSSLDQIGPICRSVRDASLLYSVLAGEDPHDATTAELPVETWTEDMRPTPDQLRIGVPREVREADHHPGISEMLERTIQRLRDAGVSIVEIDLPLTEQGISTYYVIAPAEASSNLSRYDGIRYGHRADPLPGEGLEDLYARTRTEGFGPEVRRRIMLGTYVLSAGYYDAYYKRALQVRRLIREEFDRAFQQCDLIMGPTTPGPAFRIGSEQDPVTAYLNDVYTVNANIAGIPAISIPAGETVDDDVSLPVGLHLQAPAFEESRLFGAGATIESILTG